MSDGVALEILTKAYRASVRVAQQSGYRAHFWWRRFYDNILVLGALTKAGREGHGPATSRLARVHVRLQLAAFHSVLRGGLKRKRLLRARLRVFAWVHPHSIPRLWRPVIMHVLRTRINAEGLHAPAVGAGLIRDADHSWWPCFVRAVMRLWYRIRSDVTN